MTDNICAFCKQFDIGTDGFICNRTGKQTSKNDSCDEIELI